MFPFSTANETSQDRGLENDFLSLWLSSVYEDKARAEKESFSCWGKDVHRLTSTVSVFPKALLAIRGRKIRRYQHSSKENSQTASQTCVAGTTALNLVSMTCGFEYITLLTTSKHAVNSTSFIPFKYIQPTFQSICFCMSTSSSIFEEHSCG